MSDAKRAIKALRKIYEEFFLGDDGLELKGLLAEMKQTAVETGDYRHMTKALETFTKVISIEAALDKDDKGDEDGQLKFAFDDDAPKVGGEI